MELKLLKLQKESLPLKSQRSGSWNRFGGFEISRCSGPSKLTFDSGENSKHLKLWGTIHGFDEFFKYHSAFRQ
jgi:hypothetical protein